MTKYVFEVKSLAIMVMIRTGIAHTVNVKAKAIKLKIAVD